MNVARLIDTGMGIAYQDTGRPGWRKFGVPTGGVMDGRSATLANSLLHNDPTSTLLELTLHGASIEFLADTWIALTGAGSSQSIATGSARFVCRGEVLKCLPTSVGIWSYLAIPGGWKCDQWFGSSSTDARAGIGEPLKQGHLFESVQRDLIPFEDAIVSRFSSPVQAIELTPPAEGFPIYPGPQYEQFPASTRDQLVSQDWHVSPQSDRTGYRLEGDKLELAPDITSEPVLPGSFQVPGNGLPIITMPDGPTVGGYPKIAYMEPETLWRLAQCQPGSQIKFRWV